VNTIVFTPDGKRLISAGGDRLIRIWDLATNKQLYTLIGHDEEIKAIAITSDGNYLFSGSKDIPNSIRLWNLQTRTRIWNLIGHQDLVTSLIVTKDNLKLISASQDKKAIIWDIPTLKP
jgi:WD40 repeat protein